MNDDRVHQLRTTQTDAEKRLWRSLRNRQIGGAKFRRQVSIGPYIVDFLCHDAALVIELDGGQHADRVDHDARRTAFLEKEGYRVLRFWNNDVLQNTEGVLQVVESALRANPSP